jgi:RNA polymerase sigma-70 factor (sigma-E family)
VTFEEFAARHLPALRRLGAVLAGHPSAGDDIVQEALVRAHARWRQIGALDRPEYYLRRMVVNEFLTVRRRRWRLIPGGTAAEVDRRAVPDHAAGHADRDALLAELRKLPAQQRAVLVLRYYEGLPDAEIADVLAIAPVTVRGYAARALAALRIELAPERAARPPRRPASERSMP